MSTWGGTKAGQVQSSIASSGLNGSQIMHLDVESAIS